MLNVQHDQPDIDYCTAGLPQTRKQAILIIIICIFIDRRRLFYSFVEVPNNYKMHLQSISLVFVVFLSFTKATGTDSCFNRLITSLKRLKNNCGFAPTHILDIGANQGQWSVEVRNNVFPTAQFLMIEGNSDCSELLSRFNSWAQVEIALVGQEITNITYFKMPTTTKCVTSTGNKWNF